MLRVKQIRYQIRSEMKYNLNFISADIHIWMIFYICSPFSESADTVGAGVAVPAAQAGCMPMEEVFKLAVTSFRVHDWGLFWCKDHASSKLMLNYVEFRLKIFYLSNIWKSRGNPILITVYSSCFLSWSISTLLFLAFGHISSSY